MVILRSEIKITDFFMILAWASPFNPLTAGVAYIGFFTQLLSHSVPPFKHVKAIMLHQSARFKKFRPPFCED